MQTLGAAATMAVFGWIVMFLIPRARREQEPFAIACSALAALVALAGLWLFATAVR